MKLSNVQEAIDRSFELQKALFHLDQSMLAVKKECFESVEGKRLREEYQGIRIRDQEILCGISTAIGIFLDQLSELYVNIWDTKLGLGSDDAEFYHERYVETKKRIQEKEFIVPHWIELP